MDFLSRLFKSSNNVSNKSDVEINEKSELTPLYEANELPIDELIKNHENLSINEKKRLFERICLNDNMRTELELIFNEIKRKIIPSEYTNYLQICYNNRCINNYLFLIEQKLYTFNRITIINSLHFACL